MSNRSIQTLAVGVLLFGAVLLVMARSSRHRQTEQLFRDTTGRLDEVSNLVSAALGGPVSLAPWPNGIRAGLGQILDGSRRIAYLRRLPSNLILVLPNSNCTNSMFIIKLTNGVWTTL